MSGIKDRLYKVRNRLNLKYFGIFILVVGLTYLAHDRILQWVLIPTFQYLRGLPIIGAGIDWLLLYGGAGTWNAHTISAVAICAIVSGVFCYWWGRHSVEVIEVNPTVKEAEPEPELSPLEKENLKLKEELKQLKEKAPESAAT